MARLRLQVRRAPAFEAQVRRLKLLASARNRSSPAARRRLHAIRRFEAPLPGTPFVGTNIPRSRMPKHYRAMALTNLFENRLAAGDRMMHTVMEVDLEQAIIELETLSPTQYGQRFPVASEPVAAN